MKPLPRLREFKCEKVPRPPIESFDFNNIGKHFKEIHLEIGAGVGFFAIDFCKKHPDIALIAFEHTQSKFQSFAGRIRNHPAIDNLFPLQMNAISGVTHLIESEKISTVYFNYPNPNPKNPALRWFRMPFFSQIVRTLKIGGFVRLLSNQRWYMEEAKTAAMEYWSLRLIQETPFNETSVPGGRFRTHFEKKYLLGGQICYEMTFQKL